MTYLTQTQLRISLTPVSEEQGRSCRRHDAFLSRDVINCALVPKSLPTDINGLEFAHTVGSKADIWDPLAMYHLNALVL